MVQDSSALWSATPIADESPSAAGNAAACQQACLDNDDCYRATMDVQYCYLYSDTPSTDDGWFSPGYDTATSWAKECVGIHFLEYIPRIF